MDEKDAVPSGTVSSGAGRDRRKLFRRLAALAGLGITGVLLSQENLGLIPPVEACTTGTICYQSSAGGYTIEGDDNGTSGSGAGVYGGSNVGYGVEGYSNENVGVYGTISTTSMGGVGVQGSVTNGTGVQGSSTNGVGVQGFGGTGVSGSSTSGNGVEGSSTATNGVGVEGYSTGGDGVSGSSTAPSGIGVLGSGNPGVKGTSIGGTGVEGIGNTGVYGGSTGGTGGYFQGPVAIYAEGNVGIGTGTPASALDIEPVVLSGTSPITALQIGEIISNSSAETSTIYQLFSPTLTDVSSANRLSAQLLRFVYQRDSGTTGLPTAYDSLINTTPVINENMNAALRGLTLEGPIVASGKTLGQYYGLFIGAPTGAGTISTNYALLTQPGSGNVGIGTINPAHLIQLNGGAYCDGTCSWIAGSSIRWKENITTLTDGVETLKQLHPVTYNRKETPGKTTMGFIAEEVGKVLPTVVDWDTKEAGYAEGYDHLAILALNVQATKEQQREIEQLRTENASLRADLSERITNENKELRSRIKKLEQAAKITAS